MPSYLIHRLQQIAFKLEAAEGTAETPVVGDADLTVYDVEFAPNIEKIVRNPSRQYMTPLAKIVGAQLARVSFGIEVKGSGSIAVAPSWGKVLKACKMQQAVVVTLPIGAITNGPMRPGGILTGGTSAAKGLILDRVATGAATIPLVVLSGVFQAEVVTDDLSGATANSSAGTTAAQGFNWRPVSATHQAATISFYHDGKLKKLYGAVGNPRGDLGVTGLGMLRFEFEGIYDPTTDVAMLDPTLETTVPVAFKDVSLYIDTFQADFTKLEFDLGNVRTPLRTAQAAKGARFFRVNDRTPTVTLDPYANLVADFDWHGKLNSAATSYLRAQHGSAAGNKIVLAFPALAYDDVRDENKDGFQAHGVTCTACSPSPSRGDNEVLVTMM